MPGTQSDQPLDWRERRRLRAWELRQQGWSQCRIAEELGVTQGAVSQWLERVRESGDIDALRRRPAPGPRTKMTVEQFCQLPAVLARGAKTFGFQDDHWTTNRVAIALKEVFNISYHPGHISRLLQKYCPGWREPKNP